MALRDAGHSARALWMIGRRLERISNTLGPRDSDRAALSELIEGKRVFFTKASAVSPEFKKLHFQEDEVNSLNVAALTAVCLAGASFAPPALA